MYDINEEGKSPTKKDAWISAVNVVVAARDLYMAHARKSAVNMVWIFKTHKKDQTVHMNLINLQTLLRDSQDRTRCGY